MYYLYYLVYKYSPGQLVLCPRLNRETHSNISLLQVEPTGAFPATLTKSIIKASLIPKRLACVGKITGSINVSLNSRMRTGKKNEGHQLYHIKT